MANRWDGKKIGKIPRLDDRKAGRRFSPKLGEAQPEFHECRERDYEKEKNEDASRGRPEGFLPEYSPDQIQQYKSQWERYQRGVELTIDSIVKQDKKLLYKFTSCNSLTGYWTVTVETGGATYLNIKKPVWQILCPKIIDFDVIDSDGDTFTWTQTRGKRTATLNGIILSKDRSQSFDTTVPKLDILSLCLNNGCSDDSVEPIVLNVQPEEQPELFESVIIYTTPTSIYEGLGYDVAVAAPDAAPCRQVSSNLTLNLPPAPPAVIYLQRGYQFYKGSLFVSWLLPTCDNQFLVETIWQKNTTGQYIDVQRFDKNANRLFLTQNNIHYRIRSVFNVYGRISTSDSQRFYFTNELSTGIGVAIDDNINGLSFINRARSTTLPLNKINLEVLDTCNGLSFGNVSKLTSVPLDRELLEVTDKTDGISFNATTKITKTDLGGIIIG